METRIGQVTHYFSKPGVAVLALDAELKIGDTIHIQGSTTDFTQAVKSMEVDHNKVESAAGGSEVALKVSERTRVGDEVFKVEE